MYVINVNVKNSSRVNCLLFDTGCVLIFKLEPANKMPVACFTTRSSVIREV